MHLDDLLRTQSEPAESTYEPGALLQKLMQAAPRPSAGSPNSLDSLAGAPKNPGDVVAMGRRLAAKYGYTGNEWDALYELWRRESGWNPSADNPTSSAFGIPQALTGTHDVSSRYMAGDPRAQIKWGLNYIRQRYGSPSKALAFWDENNWY